MISASVDYKIIDVIHSIYTDICGVQVRSGRRQSMPSSSIDNCARVNETVPLVACGHTKRPRSSRFENRHSANDTTKDITVSPMMFRHAEPDTTAIYTHGNSIRRWKPSAYTWVSCSR